MWHVSPSNGYLPSQAPLRTSALSSIISKLPELLARQSLGEELAALPEIAIPSESAAAVALYRDCAIIASAYLLEGRALGAAEAEPRDSLPPALAKLLVAASVAVDERPIMAYSSYCLSNHARVDAPESSAPGTPAYEAPGAWDWDALRLIRAFDGGAEEATFVLVHAEIESHTPALIRAYQTIFKGLGCALPGFPAMPAPGEALGPLWEAWIAASRGAAAGAAPPSFPEVPFDASAVDITTITAGLKELKSVLEAIVVSQLTMFNASNPRNYTAFVRPWIFGWSRGSPDFPTGVVFEGMGAEEAAALGLPADLVPPSERYPVGGLRTYLRGETGAQSTIVPSLDAVLGVAHKHDLLRDMLQELEAYRPLHHRAFLKALRAGMGNLAFNAPTEGAPAPHRLRDTLLASGNTEAVSLLNACISLVWAFRDIHVTFASTYIGRFTSKETATGGTPYKAYLRKHRDESCVHQLELHTTGAGADAPRATMAALEEAVAHREAPPVGQSSAPGCLIVYHIPSAESIEADIDAVLAEETVNGIPAFLLTRHADIIEAHGRRDGELRPSLARKCFPAASDISNFTPGRAVVEAKTEGGPRRCPITGATA